MDETPPNAASRAEHKTAPSDDPTTAPPPPTQPALRILCLHDANSNAGLLKESLGRLGDRLYQQHAVDLVYVNSPLTVSQANDNENGSDTPEEDRVWWYADDDNNDNNDDEKESVDNETVSPQYRGLDASLLLLRQVWTSLSPVWGILGVGQGSAVASVLALLPDLVPPPSFGIFIDGQAILPETERLLEGFDCLHITGDTTNSKRCDDDAAAKAELLVQQFGGQVHTKQNNKTDMNVLGRFIVDRKKELAAGADDDERNVLALCTALTLTEQQAADTIAAQIAENPPAALMAVIRPQAVAGWSGNKRSPAGGGAPCPPEFVLHREKRQGEGGPARVHPSDQQQQDQDSAH